MLDPEPIVLSDAVGLLRFLFVDDVEIDPAHRFSADTVRKLDADKSGGEASRLNSMARQIAAQYRRDTMSPVMVSGVLRLIEFALLAVSGLVLFAFHVGTSTELVWHYPAIVTAASLITVVLLEIADCYQVPALIRPVSSLGRILLAWAGALALFLLAGFFLKVSAEFSRLWFGGWFASGFILIFGFRLVLARCRPIINEHGEISGAVTKSSDSTISRSDKSSISDSRCWPAVAMSPA